MFYTSPSLKFYCHYQLSIILLSNMKKEEPTVKDEQGEPKSRPICMEGFERSMRQKQRNERKCKSRQYLQGFPPIVRQLENFTVRNSKYELLQKYSNELREDYFRWVQDSRKCEGCQNYINKIHLRYQALRSSLKYLLVNPTNDARQIAKIIIEIFDQLQEKRFCDEEDEEDETKMQIERRSRSRSRQNKKNRKRQVNKGKQKRRSNSSAEDEADE